MGRITNDVLNEKLDNLHRILCEDIKPAVKANTEFRFKSKGFIASVITITTAITAIVSPLINKIIGSFF